MAEKAQAILVLGPDNFLVDERVQEIISEVLPGASKENFSLETVNGAADKADDAVSALSATRQALLQMGFFSTDKVVWLRNLTFSGADRTSRASSVKDAIETFRADLRNNGLPEGITLIISGVSIAKNSALYKTFQAMAKAGTAQIVEVEGANVASAKKLVLRFAKENGIDIANNTVQALVDRVGFDARSLRIELEKLLTYAGGKAPSPDDVIEICTLHKEGQPWEIADTFGGRNLPLTLKTMRKLLDLKVPPILIFTVLEGCINEIALLADARERGLLAPGESRWREDLSPADAEAVAALGAEDVLAKPPFLKARSVAHARLWTARQALQARMAIVKGHENFTSSSVDPAIVLEVAISQALA